MIISLDTECTGLDFAHGAMPFLVTTCADDGTVRFWEWDVDAYTRRPDIPDTDLQDIAELLDTAELIYLQNAKFDARALLTIGLKLPWAKVRDTLVMGHLLASNHPHDLTWMCLQYLGVDIEKYELHIKEVTKKARTIAKKDYPDWLLANEGVEGMPSVKGTSQRDEDKPWKNDMWLPRALVCQWDAEGHPIDDVEWLTACQEYANADSEHTLPLGLEMERIIRQRGLWKVYEHRLQLPRIACEMEEYGLTAIGSYTEKTIADYEEYVAEAETGLVEIAAEYDYKLELAEGASLNDNMRDFFYGGTTQSCPRCNYIRRIKHWNGEVVDKSAACPKCLGRKRGPMRHQLVTVQSDNLLLPIIHNKKSGNASLDKDAMVEYLTTLEGTPREFIKLLGSKRKRGTDLTYMQAYKRFWVPVEGTPGYNRIHASLNPCATDHLRWASNSPNLQNVGKQEDDCEECEGDGCAWCDYTGKSRISVRNCFGPLPDREWYTIDFDNLELRLPGFRAREPKMIEIFEKPDEPPYWGSYHYLIASIIYPDEYWPLAEQRDGFKKKYKSTLYQWTKNFNFAKQYGCGKRKGDATAHKRGAFDMIDEGLPMLAKLQAEILNFANRNGYIETMPDKNVDPDHGYPILASRTDDGRVLSTTPFNYYVSGTACWVKNRALVRCSEKLEKWRWDGFDAHIALEIHDEILFDFPRSRTPGENHERALELKRLMKLSGDDIGIPTPASADYHDTTWAKGIAI